jgi:hypothetical protein
VGGGVECSGKGISHSDYDLIDVVGHTRKYARCIEVRNVVVLDERVVVLDERVVALGIVFAIKEGKLEEIVLLLIFEIIGKCGC